MARIIYFPWNNFRFTSSSTKSRYQNYFNFDFGLWGIPDGVSKARYGKDSSELLIHTASIISDGPLLGEETENFETVTDKRSVDILETVNKKNKKLAIFWSGGIDSSVMISSILKNWSTHDQKNVVVFLNDYSLVENPIFFHKVIKKKLKYQLFNNLKSFPKLNNYIVTDGELADKLWIPQMAINYSYIYGDNSAQNLWSNEKDNFIDFLTTNYLKDSATKIIERIEYNIQSLNFEKLSLKDILGWINFNFFWQQIYLSRYQLLTDPSPESFKEYKENYIPWYCSNDYQKWAWAPSTRAMINRSGLKKYKDTAKKYIHGIVKDKIFEYKTKVPSKLSSTNFYSENIIFEDGSVIKTNSDNYEELFYQHLLERKNA